MFSMLDFFCFEQQNLSAVSSPTKAPPNTRGVGGTCYCWVTLLSFQQLVAVMYLVPPSGGSFLFSCCMKSNVLWIPLWHQC